MSGIRERRGDLLLQLKSNVSVSIVSVKEVKLQMQIINVVWPFKNIWHALGFFLLYKGFGGMVNAAVERYINRISQDVFSGLFFWNLSWAVIGFLILAFVSKSIVIKLKKK